MDNAVDSARLGRQLSQSYKRLKFWKSELRLHPIGKERQVELEALLNTYSLLIAKLAKPSCPSEEILEAETRLHDAERKLTSLFEAKRLATSALNSRRFQ
jgi:hypothetical protein